MKVLHVLDTSIPDTAGYTTRGLYLVENQKRLGVDPVVLTSERFKGESKGAREEINGVNYYRTPVKQSVLRRFPILGLQDEVNTLYDRVKFVAEKEKVDIIHAHSPSIIGSAVCRYCKEINIPFVYEIRAFWEDAAVDRGAFKEGSLMYRLRRNHETQVVKSANKVVVICNGLREDLEKRGISTQKICVVRNGVDFERFAPLTVNEKLKRFLGLSDTYVFGFIGSFFNFEGLQDIVNAMPEIVAQRQDARLLLVGTGQTVTELKQLVKALHLEEHVKFTGRVPHNEVKGYYSIVDTLVYPRIRKRITELVTPLKPLEAMAMEKQVLMSDVGGLKELVGSPGVADFYEAGNVSDLVNKCVKIMESDAASRDQGKNARQYVIRDWSWAKRAEEDIEVYQSLLTY